MRHETIGEGMFFCCVGDCHRRFRAPEGIVLHHRADHDPLPILRATDPPWDRRLADVRAGRRPTLRLARTSA